MGREEEELRRFEDSLKKEVSEDNKRYSRMYKEEKNEKSLESLEQEVTKGKKKKFDIRIAIGLSAVAVAAVLFLLFSGMV